MSGLKYVSLSCEDSRESDEGGEGKGARELGNASVQGAFPGVVAILPERFFGGKI